MSLFNNHHRLFGNATLLFLILTCFVAIVPALENQTNNRVLPGASTPTEEAVRGKAIFIAHGCVACHTQQIRNVEMDSAYGSRPSIAADYAGNRRIDFWRNTATLMGTQRTGPDLTDIGSRQPSLQWNLLHLYNPRIVVPESIMPGYPFLFTIKMNTDSSEVIVAVPANQLKNQQLKVIATREALDLVAYLQSLKQIQLPQSIFSPKYLYSKNSKKGGLENDRMEAVNGKTLFIANCASCHQSSGEGLPGAFPSLKGSKVVNGADLKLYVDLIMNGYDANPQFGTMPPIGSNLNWGAAELTAIINYERSSWGNNGTKVNITEIEEILKDINQSKK